MNRRRFVTLSALAASSALVNWNCAKASLPPSRAKEGDFDAVVVGAGLGGLGLAALLARNGYKVCVLESHFKPGGYATSFSRSGGGEDFTCEVSLHGSAFTSPSTKTLLTELGVFDKLQLAPHKHAWTSVFPDFTFELGPAPGLDGFRKALDERFPGERDGIGRFFAYWGELLNELSTVGDGVPWYKKMLFPLLYPTMWDVRDKTLGQLMAEFVTGEKLKAVMGQWWGYYGLPPSQLSAFYYLAATGSYLQSGSYYLKGTSQSLSDALAGEIRSHGGKILLSETVDRIVTENGRAVGVRTVDGGEYRGRAVVVNGSAETAFGKLLDPADVPGEYRKRLSSFEPSISCFLVWLGLNRDISGVMSQASLSIKGGYDPDAQFQAALAGDFSSGGVGIVNYDNLVPGFSPPGCASLQLFKLCGYGPWKRFEADYLAGRKDAYREFKQKAAKAVIDKAARAIPNLRDMIVMREASSPLTNMRYTGNTAGAIYGYAQTLNNTFMNRIENRTPVPGLYLASAWGSPGGGYTGVLLSGKGAFKAMVEDWS